MLKNVYYARLCYSFAHQYCYYAQTCGHVHIYRIAGNFGGSKLWRMVLNLRFGEFNFGGYIRFPPQYIAVK